MKQRKDETITITVADAAALPTTDATEAQSRADLEQSGRGSTSGSQELDRIESMMLDTLSSMVEIDAYVDYEDRPHGYKTPAWAFKLLESGGFVVFHHDKPLGYVVGMTLAAPLFFRWPDGTRIPKPLQAIVMGWLKSFVVPRLVGMGWAVEEMVMSSPSTYRISVEFRCMHPLVLVDALAYLVPRTEAKLPVRDIVKWHRAHGGGLN